MIPRLSDQAKKLMLDAPSGTVCLLYAPTGCGKTWFFTHSLLQAHRLAGKTLLLVVNRTTLKFQSIKPILDKYGIADTNEICDSGYISLPGICIVTYQYLAQILCKPEDRYRAPYEMAEGKKTIPKQLPLRLGSVSTVVFDEAHYFLADSTFNPMNDAFKNASHVFSNAKRIYATASMGPVKSLILQMEGIEVYQSFSESNCFEQETYYVQIQNNYFQKMQPGIRYRRNCIEIVGAEEDYSYLTPCVMSGYDINDIKLDIIHRKKSGELKKALVFISSKDNGKRLKSLLIGAGISCAFIFNDETGSEKMSEDDFVERQSLIDSERFNVDVLIATEIIGNGVNIKDQSLTHVYPFGHEEISLKQQVGRARRLSNSQRITMVLRPYSMEKVNQMLQLYKKGNIPNFV